LFPLHWIRGARATDPGSLLGVAVHDNVLLQIRAAESGRGQNSTWHTRRWLHKPGAKTYEFSPEAAMDFFSSEGVLEV